MVNYSLKFKNLANQILGIIFCWINYVCGLESPEWQNFSARNLVASTSEESNLLRSRMSAANFENLVEHQESVLTNVTPATINQVAQDILNPNTMEDETEPPNHVLSENTADTSLGQNLNSEETTAPVSDLASTDSTGRNLGSGARNVGGSDSLNNSSTDNNPRSETDRNRSSTFNGEVSIRAYLVDYRVDITTSQQINVEDVEAIMDIAILRLIHSIGGFSDLLLDENRENYRLDHEIDLAGETENQDLGQNLEYDSEDSTSNLNQAERRRTRNDARFLNQITLGMAEGLEILFSVLIELPVVGNYFLNFFIFLNKVRDYFKNLIQPSNIERVVEIDLWGGWVWIFGDLEEFLRKFLAYILAIFPKKSSFLDALTSEDKHQISQAKSTYIESDEDITFKIIYLNEQNETIKAHPTSTLKALKLRTLTYPNPMYLKFISSGKLLDQNKTLAELGLVPEIRAVNRPKRRDRGDVTGSTQAQASGSNLETEEDPPVEIDNGQPILLHCFESKPKPSNSQNPNFQTASENPHLSPASTAASSSNTPGSTVNRFTYTVTNPYDIRYILYLVFQNLKNLARQVDVKSQTIPWMRQARVYLSWAWEFLAISLVQGQIFIMNNLANIGVSLVILWSVNVLHLYAYADSDVIRNLGGLGGQMFFWHVEANIFKFIGHQSFAKSNMRKNDPFKFPFFFLSESGPLSTCLTAIGFLSISILHIFLKF